MVYFRWMNEEANSLEGEELDLVVVVAVSALQELLFGLAQPGETFLDKVEVADNSIVTSIFPLLKFTVKLNLSTLKLSTLYDVY